MKSFVCKLSGENAIEWHPPIPGCGVRFGLFCRSALEREIVGVEPFGSGGLSVLHVPDDLDVEEIVKLGGVTWIAGHSRAIEKAGEAWPETDIHEDGEITGTVKLSVPTISGGTLPDFLQEGGVIEMKAAADNMVDIDRKDGTNG